MREQEPDALERPIPGGSPGGGHEAIFVQTSPRIAVVVWARHYRDSLLAILRDRDDFTVEEITPGDEDHLVRLVESPPDLVLLDLPSTELGILVRRLHAAHPSLKLIALNREETESELLPLFEAGLTGFVPAEATSGGIVESVDAALRGEFHCPPRIATALVRRLSQSVLPGRVPGETSLTTRENQILSLAEQGLTNKAIAERLGISPATVKNHMHNVLGKLSAHRRTEAIAQLRSRGWTG
ncbi:MAG TPA: response regulator transcription factor [Candidatus Eisenbacteria bacterium]|nr:response regulator transcription factor [Candidatus Eisenbacteria bacterium]